MKRSSLTYVLLGALLVTLGLPVLATITLPHTFAPGTPIKSSEVNANFAALAEGINALEASKQNAVTGSPCGAGQFVRGIGADGALECGVDQLGSGGNAGVASLNGLTGSLAIEAGANVSVNTSEDGKITVSAVGGDGSGLAAVAHDATLTGNGTSASPLGIADGGVTARKLATEQEPSAPSQVLTWSGEALVWQAPPGGGGLALPFQGTTTSANAGLQVTNSGTGDALVGLTSTGKTGVYGHNTNSEARSIGVWGRTEAAGTFGVYGSSASGYGVHGVSTTNHGVVGVSTSGDGVAGVSRDGRGVRGESTDGIGVLGISNSSSAVHGVSQSGYGVRGTTQTGDAGVFGTSNKLGGAGVLGTDGARDSIAVRGNASNNGSVGVWGQATNATGVYGQSNSGTGVWGKSTTGPAMRAEGHAVQTLGSGGWVKAMVYVDYTRPAGQQIVRCFNSQATGAAVNTPPCGMTFANPSAGVFRIDFGFDVSQRFLSVTPWDASFSVSASTDNVPTRVDIYTLLVTDKAKFENARFHLIVY